jgi:hypothetical protein
MFQAAAMQQLGKIMDPLTGEVTKDLEQAKVSIDIVDVLKEKTQGNLTKVEEEFLSKVLFELHMNYVDELKASSETSVEAESDSGSQEDGTTEPSESDSKTAEEEQSSEPKTEKNDG